MPKKEQFPRADMERRINEIVISTFFSKRLTGQFDEGDESVEPGFDLDLPELSSPASGDSWSDAIVHDFDDREDDQTEMPPDLARPEK